jgi:predicted PurR-regulated permease PerM
MNVHVTRSSGTAGVLAGAVSAVALLAFAWLARPVLVALLLAALFAFVLEPIAGTLERLKVSKPLAGATSVAVLLGTLYGVGAVTVGHARGLLGSLPRDWAHHLRNGLGSPAELATLACVVPLLVYFMLTWRTHVFEALVELFPPVRRTDARGALDTISAIVRHFLVGNLMAGAFVGSALTLLFARLDVPHFLVVGPLSGFLGVVPYLGALFALLPPLAAGAASLTAPQLLGILAAIVVLRAIGLAALYPMFVGGRLNVNPLTILLALLFGGWLWGGFGLLLAIPLAGAMKAVFDQVDSLRGWAMLMGDDEVVPE